MKIYNYQLHKQYSTFTSSNEVSSLISPNPVKEKRFTTLLKLLRHKSVGFGKLKFKGDPMSISGPTITPTSFNFIKIPQILILNLEKKNKNKLLNKNLNNKIINNIRKKIKSENQPFCNSDKLFTQTVTVQVPKYSYIFLNTYLIFNDIR